MISRHLVLGCWFWVRKGDSSTMFYNLGVSKTPEFPFITQMSLVSCCRIAETHPASWNLSINSLDIEETITPGLRCLRRINVQDTMLSICALLPGIENAIRGLPWYTPA